MTRQEIIDLIRNEYDAAPAHYKLGDDWDDGSGRIADVIMQRIEQLEAALREIVASSKRKGPPDFQYWLDVANDRREIARAALAQSSPPDDPPEFSDLRQET